MRVAAEQEGLRDGTTAVVALVQDDCLHVSHVGDSRAVLCRASGRTQALTQDHKPELAPEKQRIEALGGFVSYIGCWRAMGILAMSRALVRAAAAPLPVAVAAFALPPPLLSVTAPGSTHTPCHMTDRVVPPRALSARRVICS